MSVLGRIPAALAPSARSLVPGLVARFTGRQTGWCGCPLCNHAERQARVAMRMPLRHPERITRDLPYEQEEFPAALAEELLAPRRRTPPPPAVKRRVMNQGLPMTVRRVIPVINDRGRDPGPT